MRKLNQRGVAALEFCIIAAPLFTLIFVIFDLGRYAITVQSLHMLAHAEARAIMLNCYTASMVVKVSPAGCTTDYLSTAQKQSLVPLLYAGGLTPTVKISAAANGTSPLTVTVSQTGFNMLAPVWGTALDAPSVSTSIPF